MKSKAALQLRVSSPTIKLLIAENGCAAARHQIRSKNMELVSVISRTNPLVRIFSLC